MSLYLAFRSPLKNVSSLLTNSFFVIMTVPCLSHFQGSLSCMWVHMGTCKHQRLLSGLFLELGIQCLLDLMLTSLLPESQPPSPLLLMFNKVLWLATVVIKFRNVNSIVQKSQTYLAHYFFWEDNYLDIYLPVPKIFLSTHLGRERQCCFGRADLDELIEAYHSLAGNSPYVIWAENYKFFCMQFVYQTIQLGGSDHGIHSLWELYSLTKKLSRVSSIFF